MTSYFQPPSGFGPGSQPDEGENLDYVRMPSGMRTYSLVVPEIEGTDLGAMTPALDLLARAAGACGVAAARGEWASLPMTHLDAANRKLLAETCGEGEVSCLIAGAGEIRIQESVFAGVWVVRSPEGDRIEVAPVARDVLRLAHTPLRPAMGLSAPRSDGLVNGPALVTEVLAKSVEAKPGVPVHVINLSLLPHSPEDLDYLDQAMGEGRVRLLSRGYGNCRVSATALPNVWRVQFFNSMDTLILDTIEITPMPEVVMAAREDFEDSAARLIEVLEVLK